MGKVVMATGIASLTLVVGVLAVAARRSGMGVVRRHPRPAPFIDWDLMPL
jgi:hypothetical protein